jgi:hypothetical protein
MSSSGVSSKFLKAGREPERALKAAADKRGAVGVAVAVEVEVAAGVEVAAEELARLLRPMGGTHPPTTPPTTARAMNEPAGRRYTRTTMKVWTKKRMTTPTVFQERTAAIPEGWDALL